MRLLLASTLVSLLASTAVSAHDGHDHSTSLEANIAAANQSLLWGTYRPNLYFGLRPRLPASLLTGLLWFGAHDFQSFNKPRHECDARDELVYTFTEHDGREAGVQRIADELNNVELTLSFLKVPGTELGGSWGVRIQGKPLKPELLSRISLVNYFGNDGSLGFLDLVNEADGEGIEGVVMLKGSTQGLGDFTIRIEDHSDNSPVTYGPHAKDFGRRLDNHHFLGASVPPGQIWQAKAVLLNAISEQAKETIKPYGNGNPPDPALLYQLSDQVQSDATLYGFQRAYQDTWGVDIYFDSAELPSKLDLPTLTAGLAASSSSFHTRFASTFSLAKEFSPAEVSFAEHITANMLGGIGYFQGSSIVDASSFVDNWDNEDEFNPLTKRITPKLTSPVELFTATPSRSFFPRGFYWDEGFHLLVIGEWDNDLSLEILQSWMSLLDEDGWIAREQILGEEARSRVPKEFQIQFPNYANPPTLAMAVTAYINRLRQAGITLDSLEGNEELGNVGSSSSFASLHLESPKLAKEFLESLYAKLRVHYDWFRSTQRGQIRDWGRKSRSKTEGYRWRGRTTEHVLTSGLDDYPRAKPPHVGELHLDLLSWMGFFSKTMSEIAEFLGEEEDQDEFDINYSAIVGNIEDLHWNEDRQMYCDLTVDKADESIHVCHKGYISLFPFLLGLLPASSPHLGAVLDILRDPEQLWSPYGIRSLSTQEPLFGQGENYWRGPIWIQMNYMALSVLYKTYAKEAGPQQVRAAEIYSELRKNVIDNTFKEYERTGAVWEQYDALTGKGRRSNPFTGWSSLVALIMAEKY